MKLQSRYAFLFTTVLAALLAIQASAQKTGEGGVIKGKVKERGGKAMEGVTVRVTHARKKDFTRETKSDDKGDFEVTGLETGDYSLSFEKQGYKTFTTRKLEVIGGETLKLRGAIELPRESDPYSVIRGAVFHGAGYTLPNATVLIERIDGVKKFKQETISREGGEFAFRLKAEKAKYRVTASARGFQSASTEIDVESDEVRNISLNLQQAK